MNNTGIWSQEEADKYHASSPKLAKYLIKYLDDKAPVYDFGCGNGFYLHSLSWEGFKVKGIEGSTLTNSLLAGDEILIHDLTKPLLLPRKGTVLSFETWEHLPEWAEETFITTLVLNCYKKMVISCATPGQPGVGHINCRTHQYVIEKITGRGFILNEPGTKKIRKNVDESCDWLQRNLLVFDRL